MKKIFLTVVNMSKFAVLIVLAVCFLTVPKSNDGNEDNEPNFGVTDSDSLSYEQRYLMDKYPEFFGLNAANGLDIYVCQFAPKNYSFSLSEHSDTHQDLFDIMSMKSVDVASMRLILDTYDITREDVTVVPWQNPVSSYIGPCWILPDGRSLEEVQAEYKEMILDMFFGEVVLPSLPSYGSMQFDLDGDGKIEHCTLGFGMTSGLFSFTFHAAEVGIGEWKQEYQNVFYSDWFKLSFVKCEDGIVRVQGIDQNDKIHLFDISIVDGNVHLSENGDPIEEINRNF